MTRYGKDWNREELILAFELYCRLPFGQMNNHNRAVRELAELLGRTPGSVAMKLGNFARFDPALQARGIRGLSNASRGDREIWDEFHADWNGLSLKAYELQVGAISKSPVGAGLPSPFKEDGSPYPSVSFPESASERLATVKARIHQTFFRSTILSSYNNTCCITGLTIPEALIASHIIPWSVDEAKRTDPTNGLCLSATWDKLFDRGLITVTPEYRVKVSKPLLESKDKLVQEQECVYEGRDIRLPERWWPGKKALQWHNFNIVDIKVSNERN